VSERSGYFVACHDWTGTATKHDLSLSDVYGVVNDFDKYYEPAMNSLANRVVEPSNASHRRGPDRENH
jgi:hypothetical protein